MNLEIGLSGRPADFWGAKLLRKLNEVKGNLQLCH
jgi:hypothetical protein